MGSPSRRVGQYIEVVGAYSPHDHTRGITVGLLADVYQQYTRRALRSVQGQFFGIVQPGLALARHCFMGLNRPLMHRDDMHADQAVFVYSWKAPDDYQWTGDSHTGTIVRLAPPPNQVFVVLVREQPIDKMGVSGLMLRWNWVKEDPNLSEAPVDWQIRYGRKLWSREAP